MSAAHLCHEGPAPGLPLRHPNQEHVAPTQVAMHYAMAVQVREGRGNLLQAAAGSSCTLGPCMSAARAVGAARAACDRQGRQDRGLTHQCMHARQVPCVPSLAHFLSSAPVSSSGCAACSAGRPAGRPCAAASHTRLHQPACRGWRTFKADTGGGEMGKGIKGRAAHTIDIIPQILKAGQLMQASQRRSDASELRRSSTHRCAAGVFGHSCIRAACHPCATAPAAQSRPAGRRAPHMWKPQRCAVLAPAVDEGEQGS